MIIHKGIHRGKEGGGADRLSMDTGTAGVAADIGARTRFPVNRGVRLDRLFGPVTPLDSVAHPLKPVCLRTPKIVEQYSTVQYSKTGHGAGYESRDSYI